MSTLKHVLLQEKDQDVERKLDWSYIEWAENEVCTAGVADAETQTEPPAAVEDRQCQTSSPVIMHIDLTRSHSKLRHPSLADGDNLMAPFFQFDRQAPGRISTSPTLRRMRSTRRPLPDTWEPVGPLSPVHRVKSPLAACGPLPDGESCQDYGPVSSCERQRTRSHRSKTFDNGVALTKPECLSTRPAHATHFGFPDGEMQVSFHQFYSPTLVLISPARPLPLVPLYAKGSSIYKLI